MGLGAGHVRIVSRRAGTGRPGSGRETLGAAGQNEEGDGRTPTPPSGCAGAIPRPGCPRRVKTALVAVGVAVAMGWLIWAALVHAQPAVSTQVTSYEATDTVDRGDLHRRPPRPDQPVSCRVIAQAANHETVGEQTVPVAGGAVRLVDVSVEVKTVRRAVAATVGGCTLG